jgi:dUTPase
VKLYYSNKEYKPRYVQGDAGIDLKSVERVILQPGDNTLEEMYNNHVLEVFKLDELGA